MSRLGFLWIICWREIGIFPRLMAFGVGGSAAMSALSGYFGPIIVPWWGWLVAAALVFFLIIVVRTFESAYHHERALEPKVSISDPISDHLPWNHPADGKALRFYSIEIVNLSRGNITNCEVKEFRFENRLGRVAPESGRHFRKRTERTADGRLHSYVRQVNLRGEGDKETFDICMMEEREENSRVLMAYATTPSDPSKNNIPRALFPHTLTVRVTADSLRIPQDKSFKIFVTDDGFLKMETAENV